MKLLLKIILPINVVILLICLGLYAHYQSTYPDDGLNALIFGIFFTSVVVSLVIILAAYYVQTLHTSVRRAGGTANLIKIALAGIIAATLLWYGRFGENRTILVYVGSGGLVLCIISFAYNVVRSFRK